jgi:predicted RNA-binding Zn ribbon-like protein
VRSGTEPGGREPAPEPLRLVQRFVNSNDREGGYDTLATPAAAARWFRESGMSVGRLSGTEVERAVELRETLRALLIANNGQAVDEQALRRLNAAAARTRVRLAFGGTTASLIPQGTGIERALGHIIAAVFGAMVDGNWPRLKACRRDACRWAFYDHSKNKSGTWCAMEICGNRVKTRAYRRRTAPRSSRKRAQSEREATS